MTTNQAYTDKFFLNNLFSFVIYVLNPRFLFIMAVMIALGSLIFVAPYAGIFLNLLVLAVSFKFAVDILRTTSEGFFNPDDVSFSENEYIVVVQVIVIGIILNYLTEYAFSANNNGISLLVVIGLQFIMPAIYMVLAYSGSFLQALNPVTLIRFIKPWFFTYTIFTLFYLFTIYLESQGIFMVLISFMPYKLIYFISAFIMVFFLFLNFHIMGFLIYQNFNEDGDSDEVPNNSDSGSSDTDRSYTNNSNRKTSNEGGSDSSINANPIYTRINNLIKSKTTDEALAIIQELQKEGDDSTELEVYKQQALFISNENFKLPVAEHIHNLIVQNKIGTAFKLLEEIYVNKDTYTETHESDLGKLADHAFNSQKFSLVLKLLHGFSKKHPHSHEIVPNYYLVAQVLYKHPKTKSKSIAILNGLIKKYPNHEKIHELKSWAKGIELMQNKPADLDY